jgi:undecaprenyl-diphosphatase
VYRPLRFIVARLRPGAALGLTLTIGLVVIGLTGWAFGAITQDVVARETSSIDRPVYRFFLHHRGGGLTDAMQALTYLGGSSVLIGIVAVVGLAWWLRRRTWRPLVVGLGAWAGAAVLTNSVKAVIDRPRPPAVHFIGAASGASFPSGHATDAVAVYGILAALLAAATPLWSRKVGAWVAAAILWIVVGTSRLYLGVHWLTDVLGGAALGGLWLFTYLTAIHAVEAVARQRAVQPEEVEPSTPDRSADAIPR